ncbi:DUF2254 domain-containing protein [Brevibacterium sp. 50QC2O2]|uniref:DUF2254 domain-containing protein n=1 Tax=Brevibacterium sp. 50QC2O2 TaxID=2968459 RepID=UPI00211B98A8|nr:DUF2254 domain-containing protein [Brevibacterium sp. 50QC2O2]MCQ9387448.1 DUF2254 domain-containing protein [Brevibacterium sp. 50QC2O2]
MGSLLGIISGAMVTLAGLVFSALTPAMSLGVTALSVRISPVFQADREGRRQGRQAAGRRDSEPRGAVGDMGPA